MGDISFLENLWLALHVLVGEFVGSEELELVDGELDGFSDLEVSLCVVLGSEWVHVSGSLQELAPPDTRVLVSDLVNLDRVVPAEEGDDEVSGIIVFGLGDESCLVSKDELVLGVHLIYIFLGWLWLESVD